MIQFLFNVASCQSNCKPKDCFDLKCYRVSKTKDGPQSIYPGRPTLPSVQVSCDQTSQSGGWIVFQRRVDGSVNFTRNWAAFRNGFGSHGGADTELWLGNENVHQIILEYGNITCDLSIEGYGYDGTSCIMGADVFTLGPESDYYRLQFRDFTSHLNAFSDDILYHRDAQFSTYDRGAKKKCSDRYLNGSWWFNNCTRFYLNGPIRPRGTFDYYSLYVETYKGKKVLKGSQMMFRPTVRPQCNNPCENGGTCEYLAASNSCRCVCPLSHCGRKCELENSCVNGGSCVHDEAANKMSCKCTAGYPGPSCRVSETDEGMKVTGTEETGKSNRTSM